MTEINKMNECYYCANKRNVQDTAYVKCLDFSIEVKGNKHGVKNGWFLYPQCFDPVWKETNCPNFKKMDGKNEN